MDMVFDLHGRPHCIDTAVVTPFSASAGLIASASTRPGFMAKREEKRKFDRDPRINLIPFILESTGRPGYHAQKFIKYLFSDADHPPTAIREAWGRHPDHTPQLHLQTTTQGGHHVAALATVSHPPYHLLT